MSVPFSKLKKKTLSLAYILCPEDLANNLSLAELDLSNNLIGDEGIKSLQSCRFLSFKKFQ